jgi:hypothetical protein
MSLLEKLPLGLGNLFISDKFREHFSPEHSKELIDEVIDAVDLGKNISLKNESYDKYSENRVYNQEGFKETRGPKNLKVYDKLSLESDNAKSIKKLISESLQPTEEYINAQKKFKRDFDTLNEINQKSTIFNAQSKIKAVIEITQEGRKSIVAQQKKEVDALTNKLNENLEKLRTTLGLADNPADNDITKKTITAMVKDLQESHRKQLETFDNNNRDQENKLHVHANAVLNQKIFLEKLRENNPDMEKAFREIDQNKNPNAQNNTIMSTSAQNVSLKHINIEDVKKIVNHLAKHEITKVGNTYQIKIDNYLWSILKLNPLYHLDPRGSTEAGYRTMAHSIKLLDPESGIEFAVNFDPESTAVEEAQKVYRACREAGFADEDIVVKVNGKKMEKDKIFEKCPSKLQLIETKAEQYKEENVDIKVPFDKANASTVREEIKRIQQEQDELDKPNQNNII